MTWTLWGSSIFPNRPHVHRHTPEVGDCRPSSERLVCQSRRGAPQFPARCAWLNAVRDRPGGKMAWFLAPTLVQLRSEVNRRWPIRDKTSDGTLGNAAHQAGTSDHNPDSRGCVCAIDFDEDLTIPADDYPSFHRGDGARPLVRELLALARDGQLPQLRYIISEGKIYSSTYGFKEQDYEGSNPHDHHAHVSINHTPSLADRTITWGIQVAISSTDVSKIATAVEAKLRGSQAFRRAVADELLARDAIPNWVNPEENQNLQFGNAINLIGKQTK